MASSLTKNVLMEKITDAIAALDANDNDKALNVLKSVEQKKSRSSKSASGAPKEKRAPTEFNNFIKKKMDELKTAGVGKDVRERLSMASQAWNEYKVQNGIVSQPKKSKNPAQAPAEKSKPMEKEEYPEESEDEEEERE